MGDGRGAETRGEGVLSGFSETFDGEGGVDAEGFIAFAGAAAGSASGVFLASGSFTSGSLTAGEVLAVDSGGGCFFSLHDGSNTSIELVRNRVSSRFRIIGQILDREDGLIRDCNAETAR